MFMLKSHNPAKVIQAQHCWFAAMPGKADYLIGTSFNVLGDIPLQDIVSHAK